MKKMFFHTLCYICLLLKHNFSLSLSLCQQLRHENLVNLIEVFRRKKRLYLVFEFVDRTALDDLEHHPTGVEENYAKKVMWQVLKGVEFCHMHNVGFHTAVRKFLEMHASSINMYIHNIPNSS